MALRLLYQLEFAEEDAAERERAKAAFWEISSADAETKEYSRRLVEEVGKKKRELDEAIANAAEHWALDRIALLERNILRIAIAEMWFLGIPGKVVIDEAVELAKKYGADASSYQFVNGVLDFIYHCYPPPNGGSAGAAGEA